MLDREKDYKEGRKLRKSGSIVIIIFLTFQTAGAQVQGISEGDRVKITAPSIKSGNIKGAVLTLESSFLTVSESDTTFTVDYSSIRR